MKTISDRTRWTLGTCVVASLLAGCGGPPAQNGLPSTMERSAPNSVAPDGWGGGHKGSWMAPQAKHDNLVYVSDTAANAVSVYAWKTHKLVGMLGGINQPFGLCSDQSGNVWIISWGKNQISEYAHAGTKPLKTLAVQDPDANLYDCSVDPTTGDLAVTNWGYVWYKGDILIYTMQPATRKLTPVRDSGIIIVAATTIRAISSPTAGMRIWTMFSRWRSCPRVVGRSRASRSCRISTRLSSAALGGMENTSQSQT